MTLTTVCTSKTGSVEHVIQRCACTCDTPHVPRLAPGALNQARAAPLFQLHGHCGLWRGAYVYAGRGVRPWQRLATCAAFAKTAWSRWRVHLGEPCTLPRPDYFLRLLCIPASTCAPSCV
jgi:hypothetical protein